MPYHTASQQTLVHVALKSAGHVAIVESHGSSSQSSSQIGDGVFVFPTVGAGVSFYL